MTCVRLIYRYLPMANTEPEPPSEDIKTLFESDKVLSKDVVEQQRPLMMHRARASVGFRDTILFAFITIWAFFRE